MSPSAAARKPIPLRRWIGWMAVLAVGLFVFYVVFTPVWMGIRLVVWLAEGRGHRHGRPPAGRI